MRPKQIQLFRTLNSRFAALERFGLFLHRFRLQRRNLPLQSLAQVNEFRVKTRLQVGAIVTAGNIPQCLLDTEARLRTLLTDPR